MIKYIILGVVQGFTEFLPVSSSGHLVIMQNLFGMNSNSILIFVILHLGTVFAVITFFFKDIINLMRNMRLILLVIVVTLLTGIIALIGKDFFESLFFSPKAVAISLFVTAIVLLIAQKAMHGERNILNTKDAFILGAAQGLAIIPGISRSGITISSLLLRGIRKEEAFRFSFIASIPAIFGAAILELKDAQLCAGQGEFFNLIIGFMASFLSGLLALRIFKKLVLKTKLHYFAYYCIMVAVITLLFIPRPQ